MHLPPTPTAASSGTESATSQDASCAAVRLSSVLTKPVGQDPQAGAPSLRCRVERIQRDIDAGRTVLDDELKQHARDLTFLMESQYDRFQAGDGEEYRVKAMELRQQRDAALGLVSAAGQAARHAQIEQRAAAEPGGSGCYFADMGERDRQAPNDSGKGALG